VRERARKAKTQMRNEIVPLAETLERAGTRFPAIVARFGADGYAYTEEWLTRLQTQLDEERPAGS
jgi:hypothetical protein